MAANEHDNDFDTTVLSVDYSDFQDTVVDQVIAFDPSLFQGESADRAQQAQRPTWVSAGSGYTNEQQPVMAQTQQVTEVRPTWTQAQPTMPNNYSQRNPDEDTWVLGTQQPAWHSAAYNEQPRQQPRPAAQPPRYSVAPPTASASWQSAPRTTSTMMAATDKKPDRTNKILIGVIVVLAVVAVFAIIMVIALLLAPNESAKSTPAATPVVTTAPSSSSTSTDALTGTDDSSKEAEKSDDSKSSDSSYNRNPGSPVVVTEGGGRALSETNLYELLTDYYNKAGSYDKDVVTCAEDFNANYLKEDKSTRSAKASAVATLKAKIKSDWDELKEYEGKLPFMSKNVQSYKDMCELYECLYHRIDVMDQAWKIDLTYDKPKEHEAEIVAPLRAQQVGGNDKYFTRFRELYPNVNIVKP